MGILGTHSEDVPTATCDTHNNGKTQRSNVYELLLFCVRAYDEEMMDGCGLGTKKAKQIGCWQNQSIWWSFIKRYSYDIIGFAMSLSQAYHLFLIMLFLYIIVRKSILYIIKNNNNSCMQTTFTPETLYHVIIIIIWIVLSGHFVAVVRFWGPVAMRLADGRVNIISLILLVD